MRAVIPGVSCRFQRFVMHQGLVGAAGFEPATCSTQNCRATRLRYTPPGADLDTRFAECQQGANSVAAVAENRTYHPIPRRDPEPAGRAADHFEDRPHRPAGWDQAIRHRLGIFGDPQDASVTADKDHIERDIGVVHPERYRLLLMEIEEHTVTFWQLLTEHEAALAFRLRGRELD